MEKTLDMTLKAKESQEILNRDEAIYVSERIILTTVRRTDYGAAFLCLCTCTGSGCKV